MVDYTDYDAWSAEADEDEGPQARVAGQVWTLPHRGQVPAKAVADFQRLRAAMTRAMADGSFDDLDDDDEVPEAVTSDVLDGMEKLTPAALLRTLTGGMADEMLEAGASHAAIEGLARDYSQYVEQGEGPLAPEPPPANRAERRQKAKGNGARGSGSKTSPNGGGSSKPTSSANTDSS